MLAASISTSTDDRVRSSATSRMVPETPLKRPLTVVNIMCLALNSTSVCAGSMIQLVENLLGVLADLRSAPRSHFRLLVQAHRTVDRQARLPAAIVERHQYVVGNQLWVCGDLVESLRDTVGEIGRSKQLAPLGERSLRELRIQQRHQLGS